MEHILFSQKVCLKCCILSFIKLLVIQTVMQNNVSTVHSKRILIIQIQNTVNNNFKWVSVLI